MTSHHNRRRFLALTGAAALGGCGAPKPAAVTVPLPTLSDEEKARVEQELAVRRKHLADLEAYRVGTGESRKTPPPAVNIGDAIPELKSQIRLAQRMHPRFGEEPPPDASKFGGKFYWPADDAWPADPGTRIPLAGVLQLVGDDVWPRITFRTGYDILQLLWTPRDPVSGELNALVKWRRRSEVEGRPLLAESPTELAYPSLVPVPCRVHPEWVVELPDWETLQRTDLRAKLGEWKPPGEAKPAEYYTRYLAASHGSKAGGWQRESLKAPPCKLCQRPMDYLLTVDATEWSPDDASRWRPTQDPDDALGRRAATGLSFSGGNAVEVHICHRCDAWPVRAMVVK